MKRHIVLGLLLALCALPGCAGSGSDANQPGTVPAGIELDPTMPEDEKALVASDIEQIATFGLQAHDIPYYEQIFGGPDSRAALSYYGERVHYILPRYTNVIGRVLLDGEPAAPGVVEVPTDPMIQASNDGTWLWLTNEATPGDLTLEFGDGTIPLTSTRVGIITLGPGYTATQPRMARVSTQIHEARHSDCTGGLPESDVARIAAGQEPLTQSCGHLHVNCPPGHELAGLPGCDGQAWGAYAVQMVYSRAVYEACRNCSEEDTQVALIDSLDAASRVLVLEPMLSGALGPPDMSSTGVVPG